MVARIKTVAFQGLKFPLVDVQVQISKGLPVFNVVGLAQKSVSESRERVRSALSCLGLALPNKRITVNLSPADLPKDGNHYDLPIALGILCALEVIPPSGVEGYLAAGELELDGSIARINGTIAVALLVQRRKLRGLICPESNGAEAAWIKDIDVLAAGSLLSLVNHFQGKQVLSPPERKRVSCEQVHGDMADVYGQQSAKRALEIAAAGNHNVLFIGPPGIGKSMLISRMPSILPPLEAQEILEVAAIRSLSGQGGAGDLTFERPFRAPHHTASAAAMIGGGKNALPGEISLSHRGVLFLDELPEFNRAVLDALRQPMESGAVIIARANQHVKYPARFQLLAAMNPCRCGGDIDSNFKCRRGAKCALDYQGRISGPLLDRIDIRLDLPALLPSKLSKMPAGSKSEVIQARVVKARNLQLERAKRSGLKGTGNYNASRSGRELEAILQMDAGASKFLKEFADKMRLSVRGYTRTLKLARTIADLEESGTIKGHHLAEALAYRGGDLPAER